MLVSSRPSSYELLFSVFIHPLSIRHVIQITAVFLIDRSAHVLVYLHLTCAR